VNQNKINGPYLYMRSPKEESHGFKHATTIAQRVKLNEQGISYKMAKQKHRKQTWIWSSRGKKLT